MEEPTCANRQPAEAGNDGLTPDARKLLQLAEEEKLFDASSYRLKAEAEKAGLHPFVHYLEIGERQGISPAPGFDPAYYLDHNPDVKAAGLGALLHYLRFGRDEGRKPSAAVGRDKDEEYAAWVAEFDTWTPERLEVLRKKVAGMARRPRISVVMPTFNTPEVYLRAAIESVTNQIYPEWELCIADDASTAPHVRQVLEEYAARDPRVRFTVRTENGHISLATNSALELATGDYIAFLDHDDALTAHALYFVADAIVAQPDARLIYSDEDKIDELGMRRHQPHFKGDWNIDQLYSQNYICHLLVIRRDIVQEVGGLRPGVEGSQDFDLILRSLAHITPEQIVHISRVLYHWRAIPGSTARSRGEKSYASAAGIKSLRDHFAERGEDVEVIGLKQPTVYRVRRKVPSPAPHVDILVPTRDRKDLVATCIESITRLTDYPDYGITIIDNRSSAPEALAYFANLARSDQRIRVLPCDMDFNFSAINNYAAARSEGPILALLNNDIEVISPDWLTELVSHAVRPDVGCVGAKLYYPNNTIQHAGIIIGVGGVAGHSHKNRRREDLGYFGRMQVVSEVSAVTGACLVLRKDVFDEVGGLDEEHLSVAFNDVDLCMRVRAAGYRNIFTPHAELYHHESLSRGYEDTPEKKARFASEVGFMKQRWGKTFESDPFFNPNLSYKTEDFGLAWPPRISD